METEIELRMTNEERELLAKVWARTFINCLLYGHKWIDFDGAKVCQHCEVDRSTLKKFTYLSTKQAEVSDGN